MILSEFLERDLGFDVGPEFKLAELTCRVGEDREFLPAATDLLRRWTRDPLVLTSLKDFSSVLIGDPELNRAGLHVARVVLSNYAARRYLNAPWFLTDGLLTIPDFLPPDLATDAARLVDSVALIHEAKCNANRPGPGLAPAVAAVRTAVLSLFKRHTRRLWGTFDRTAFVQRVARREDDPQWVAHSDTFFPALKWWWFPHAVGALDGPFQYAVGSPHLTPELLRWRHRVALAAAAGEADPGTREGSFRCSRGDLATLRLDLRPVTVAANTLMIADVFGVHSRGVFPPGVERVALHGSIRLPRPFDVYQEY